MSDGKRACSTPGCILWSKHVTPCTTAEQLIRAMDDKEAVLAERDVLVARCKVLEEALTAASLRLYQLRKRCGCLSMKGVCPNCSNTIGVERAVNAALTPRGGGAKEGT